MDTLPGPVSTTVKDHLNLLRPPPGRFHHSINIPSLYTNLSSTKPKPPTKLPPPLLHHHHHHNHSLHRVPSSPPRARPPHLNPAAVHRKASTGYAAALLDAARCGGVLGAVEQDVGRFMLGVRKVLSDPSVGEAKKGEVVKGVAELGGFDKRLTALVRMLVEKKKKVGLVWEVMEEFRRLYDELSGTRTVVVSSQTKMGEGELRRIAEEVQKRSGAAKVKVRHLYAQSN